jgi:rhamnose utilization protein RhaD (predicted bifunctional aldolase and dehydrogenase)/NAD(P)-dependent dehydrogenase (short-subunit alcohol dehydrogenase family)
MKSLWNNADANKIKKDLLALRVYTSRLLGQDEDLVMHGGGNTSVKIKEKNIFGEEEEILYVKGSGWDLGTIEKEGFAPVKLDALHKLANLDQLSDMEMVKYQRMALTNPMAPNPSVEAILHAIIPFVFVDHSHADAIVTMTNSPNGKKRIEETFGERILIIPYVMPGFILAKKIYEMTKDLDWSTIDGMILMNHGVFTFDNDPKVAYENMISIVSKAEQYLKKHAGKDLKREKAEDADLIKIAQIRKSISEVWGKPVMSRLNDDGKAVSFSNQKDARKITDRGPLTPDHIIRTKRTPLFISDNFQKDLDKYVQSYTEYFQKFKQKGQSQLDSAPRWAVWPGQGALSFGPNVKSIQIIEDITTHTRKAIHQAEQLGSWDALPQKDLFEMEYWSLEQAKLKKAKSSKAFEGKVAVVSGAVQGIGKACVEYLVQEGASVAALDIDSSITKVFDQKEVLGIKCDLTSRKQREKAIELTIKNFGGIDMLISNAGIFPKSHTIAEMDENLWQKSMDINLTSHMELLKLVTPFLALGFDPAVVFIASKNVPAPGPGAAAYSVAKAGLTQLARVAALELGKQGIRINVLHPNAVYDTGIWTDEVLKARAKHYGLTVKEYKTNNVLQVELKSMDVAKLAATMLGSTFAKVTGAQIPIDGGNERVI